MREGLLRIIEEQTDMVVVAEATDGEMAVEITRDLQPDVVVMDVNMSKMNGIEATRQITSEFPEITVVGLSVNEDTKTAFAMREVGASAYLSKGGSFEMLCATIRTVRAKKSKP